MAGGSTALKNRGRNVTADRFYSGCELELCEDLMDNMAYGGTVMASPRPLPDDAKKTEVRQKLTVSYWPDEIMLASYTKKGRTSSPCPHTTWSRLWPHRKAKNGVHALLQRHEGRH